jgi:N-dimethylarginine dimethylaminohydrolase
MSRHVLMCEPVHYRIEYEINPWMRRSNAVEGPRALEQWRDLHRALLDLGVRVELVEQQPGVPDMTFTANAGIAMGRRFIPANFRYPEREAEEPYFIEWFRDRGYEVTPVHRPHYWEGEGDVLPAGDRVFGGYRFRTEERAFDHLDEIMEREIVRLELVDERFYHLDTCFCPLGGGRAMYYPPAFSPDSRACIERSFDDLVAVPEEDALRFACNALVVNGRGSEAGGDRAVVMNTGCEETAEALRRRGFRPVETPTDEFIKAGGSVKCLLLMLDAHC